MAPDYAGHSILNLIQSLAAACGRQEPGATPLAALPVGQLAQTRHIVFLVIDGLGQKTLDGSPAAHHLRQHTIATLTSVFPSTTASAIPSFMTGVAPAQHGLTGWHMYLEEIDQTLAILPMTPRGGPGPALPEDLLARLFATPPLYPQLGRESWVLAPQRITGTPFNSWHAQGANSLAYTTLDEMFVQLVGLLTDAPCARYVYAYFPELDSVSHRHGTSSEQACAVLGQIDAGFGAFVEAVSGRDAWVIVSADHGLIDSPPERNITLDEHPDLAALLARPLCGERRVAYCHVAPANHAAFEAYVREHLPHCADLYTSEELIATGWFGPPPHHPRLRSRLGDYVLLMKENWTIIDWLPGERRYRQVGVHGGTSADEMLVPLIAVRV